MADFWTAPDVIASLPYSDAQDTTGATESGDDPTPAIGYDVGPVEKTVWYSWVADHSGRIAISTLGSDYDTLVSVWTRPAGSFVEIASNNWQQTFAEMGTGSRIQSELEFTAVSGTTYYIMVGDYNLPSSGGSLVFKMWADTVPDGTPIVIEQETSSTAGGTTPNPFVDSQGNYYRYGFATLFDTEGGGTPVAAYLFHAMNVVGGTVTLVDCTLTGVASGNTLVYIEFQENGSVTEAFFIEISGLSQVLPRDVVWDEFGNSEGSVDNYESPAEDQTSHLHALTGGTQTAIGLWIAFHVSNDTTTSSTPTGFTASALNGSKNAVYYRVTTTTESAVQAAFTTGSAVNVAGAIVSYRRAVSSSAESEPPTPTPGEFCPCIPPTPTEPVPPGTPGGTGGPPPVIPHDVIGVQLACIGGGLVPTEADLVPSELWWGL